jgi:hypothetical protein
MKFKKEDLRNFILKYDVIHIGVIGTGWNLAKNREIALVFSTKLANSAILRRQKRPLCINFFSYYIIINILFMKNFVSQN